MIETSGPKVRDEIKKLQDDAIDKALALEALVEKAAAISLLRTALIDMIVGAVQLGHEDHPFVTRARAALQKTA